MVQIKHIGIVGAGAWGTAVAAVLAQHHTQTQINLYCRRADHAAAINASHQNADHLPDIQLPPNLIASADLASIAQTEILIMGVPCQELRQTLQQAQQYYTLQTPIVLLCKGVEQGSHALPSQVVTAVMGSVPTAILAGPNFASEVAQGLPSAVTLACADETLGQHLAEQLQTPSFRPYVRDDLVGVQVAAALKNVLAIASGVVTGAQLGENARAALLTRGIAEIIRLLVAMGGQPQTMLGLSGIGDIMLTCQSVQSRNFTLGLALGQGQSLADYQARQSGVTEGVHTVGAALALAAQHEVDMPVCTAVQTVLHGEISVKETLKAFFTRPLKVE